MYISMVERSRKDVLERYARAPESNEPPVFKLIQEYLSVLKGAGFADRLGWYETAAGAELRLAPPDIDKVPEGFSGTVSGYEVTDSFARYFSYDELQQLYELLASQGFRANRDDIDRSAIRLVPSSGTEIEQEEPSYSPEAREQREVDPTVRKLINTVVDELTKNYDGEMFYTDRLEYLELAGSLTRLMVESGEDPNDLLMQFHDLSDLHPQLLPFMQYVHARMQNRGVQVRPSTTSESQIREYGAILSSAGRADEEGGSRTNVIGELESFVASSEGKPDLSLWNLSENELFRQCAYEGDWDKIEKSQLAVFANYSLPLMADILIHACPREGSSLDMSRFLDRACDLNSKKIRSVLSQIAKLWYQSVWYQSGKSVWSEMADQMLLGGLLKVESTRAKPKDIYSFEFVSMLYEAYKSRDVSEVQEFHTKLIAVIDSAYGDDSIKPYLRLFQSASLHPGVDRSEYVEKEKNKILLDDANAEGLAPWEIECWAARLGHGEGAPDSALYNQFRTARKQLIDAKLPDEDEGLRIEGLERFVAHMQTVGAPLGIILDEIDRYVAYAIWATNKKYEYPLLRKVIQLYASVDAHRYGLVTVDEFLQRKKVSQEEHDDLERLLLVHAELSGKEPSIAQKKRSVHFSAVEGLKRIEVSDAIDMFLETDFSVKDLRRLDTRWLSDDTRFSSKEKGLIAEQLLYWCSDNMLDSRLKSVLNIALPHYDFHLGQEAPQTFIRIIQGLRLQQAFEEQGILE